MELNIDQLFTADSLLTLQGGAAAAYIVPTVLNQFWALPRWLSQLISALIALGLSGYAAWISAEPTVWTWVVAVFNAFLITFTALGLNQYLGKIFGRPETSAPPTPAPQTPAPAPAAKPAAVPAGQAAAGLPVEAEQAPRAPMPAPARRSNRGWSRSWL